MFLYNLRLARQSLAKQPLLTALMIAAIAVGVGACMTVVTYVYSVSSDPIPSKSDQLYTVRLDSWGVDEPFNDEEPEQAPWQLTHRDAMALTESNIPVRHAAMRKAVFTAVSDDEAIPPFLTISRMTGGDFFGLFDVPFLYGGGWDAEADRNAHNVVVLSRETNERLFGGEDSVGRDATFGTETFRVVGVLNDWQPNILFYDVNNGALESVEDIFMPFSITNEREINNAGNTNCWKDELIEGYFDLLQSECIYVQYWAELSDNDMKQRYQLMLDAYTGEQKKLGRFERPTNNQLTNVTQWLKVREVVRDSEMAVLSIAILFLIACLFNTVGLILARFVSKAPQIGIRRALGASKTDIFRQHIVEVGLVGFSGGIIGLLLAFAGVIGLRKLLPPYAEVLSLDLTMAAMTMAVSVTAAIVAGLYPTWRVCQMPPASYLKSQ